jgi:hypothetical protein
MRRLLIWAKARARFRARGVRTLYLHAGIVRADDSRAAVLAGVLARLGALPPRMYLVAPSYPHHGA